MDGGPPPGLSLQPGLSVQPALSGLYTKSVGVRAEDPPNGLCGILDGLVPESGLLCEKLLLNQPVHLEPRPQNQIRRWITERDRNGNGPRWYSAPASDSEEDEEEDEGDDGAEEEPKLSPTDDCNGVGFSHFGGQLGMDPQMQAWYNNMWNPWMMNQHGQQRMQEMQANYAMHQQSAQNGNAWTNWNQQSDGSMEAWNGRPKSRPRKGPGEWIQALVTSLAGESQEVINELLTSPGPSLALSLAGHSKDGSQIVQGVFGDVDRKAASRLARQFEGKVVDLVYSPHGNHAIKKILEVLVPAEYPFLITELQEDAKRFGCRLACHQFGCRVYIQLIKSLSQSTSEVDEARRKAQVDASKFVDWLLDYHFEELVKHDFGHFVVEQAVMQGQAHQKQRVVGVLLSNFQLMHNEKAAYVFEKVCRSGSRLEQDGIAERFLNLSEAEFQHVKQSKGGRMVLRALLDVGRGSKVQEVQKRYAQLGAQAAHAKKQSKAAGKARGARTPASNTNTAYHPRT